MWLFLQMFLCLRVCVNNYGNSSLFELLVTELQAFLVMNRSQLYLAYAPASLNDVQKMRLLGSLVFSGELFDSATLETVIAEHQGEVSTGSSQSLVKAILSVLPSLIGKGI